MPRLSPSERSLTLASRKPPPPQPPLKRLPISSRCALTLLLFLTVFSGSILTMQYNILIVCSDRSVFFVVQNPMDTNIWRPTAPGGEPVMDMGDWRAQLHPESRKRIVNKIMDTLKRHLPFSGQEGLQELKKIAVRFEEKIYTVAANQVFGLCYSDYLRKISLKMLTMESKSQNTIRTANVNKPLDPGGNNAAKH
ncbi:hypothetical protein SADUNF_Sadunf13G0080500 [Salix dunnii]|uniref:Mediator complex subunit 15 KIX domain-containing protein n=1 Tax=Salix dunnii TaxID=1413687 RepID=A0A835JL18_9ROSI|nr:hypothetical protein SADUNF_Sadunf13G0080500 [Salix dunnii]